MVWHGVKLALIAVAVFAAAVNLVSLLITAIWLRKRRRVPSPATNTTQLGVTILKPLCGVDEELEENLHSFFALNHAPLQLVFCAEDPHDPALVIARRVARSYPAVPTTVMHHRGGHAASPKVRSLEAMLPHARHPIVMLSDSNVRIGQDDLSILVAPFADEKVGMVYQPVAGIRESSAAAAVENLRWSDVAGVLTIGLRVMVGQHPATGKGMLFRRTALKSIGDFSQVGFAGAEDYVLAETTRKAGWKLEVGAAAAQVVHTRWSWGKFFARHVRHAGFRRKLAPKLYPFEMILNPVLMAVPLLFIGPIAQIVAASVIGTKLMTDYLGIWVLRGSRLPLKYVPLCMIKDLVMLAVWGAGLGVRHVSWREKIYVLGDRSMLIPISSPMPSSIPFPAAQEAPRRRQAG